MTVPANPKIYHIVHHDRLPSILARNGLLSDAQMHGQHGTGTVIGMNKIKQRRMTLPVKCHTGLFVGQCVPFYFCPRSIMLYMFQQNNHAELTYTGGQEPIVHLEADLRKVVHWAEHNNKKWAFTLSNAGSYFFEDRNDLNCLHEINWAAVNEPRWSQCKDAKQAEFLIESSFPWGLVERIGVYSQSVFRTVNDTLHGATHKPRVEILPVWYY